VPASRGIGAAEPNSTTAGNRIASFYMTFAGVGYLSTAAFLNAPVAHRVLYHLHPNEAGLE
jgi:hypothetical protein